MINPSLEKRCVIRLERFVSNNDLVQFKVQGLNFIVQHLIGRYKTFSNEYRVEWRLGMPAYRVLSPP